MKCVRVAASCDCIPYPFLLAVCAITAMVGLAASHRIGWRVSALAAGSCAIRPFDGPLDQGSRGCWSMKGFSYVRRIPDRRTKYICALKQEALCRADGTNGLRLSW
jgi:hypothetical protein